jgi:multimeric flavodoxin WrbA
MQPTPATAALSDYSKFYTNFSPIVQEKAESGKSCPQEPPSGIVTSLPQVLEQEMANILAVYGSPRRKGNTALLLKRAVEGAREAGGEVEEFVLRDLKMSPCLEIYGCKETGRCAIKDDFQVVYDKLLACDGLMLASPIFFYTVSSHTKILMDRCQSLWVKRYWLEKTLFGEKKFRRKGLFVAAGATKGKKLFDGVLLTVRYFFDALGMELWKALLYRGLDFEGDVLKHPEYLDAAYAGGEQLSRTLSGHDPT